MPDDGDHVCQAPISASLRIKAKVRASEIEQPIG